MKQLRKLQETCLWTTLQPINHHLNINTDNSEFAFSPHENQKFVKFGGVFQTIILAMCTKFCKVRTLQSQDVGQFVIMGLAHKYNGLHLYFMDQTVAKLQGLGYKL